MSDRITELGESPLIVSGWRMLLVRGPIQREYWGLSAIILIGALLVSPGFFSIDEAIYYAGARAIAEGGTLGINTNGFEQFHSESLKLRLLVEGPQGLTPQYPAGSALLAGMLLPFLGPRAFILLNALAAIATLFTVRKICLSQFKSETVARIAVALLVAGTFWVEYAVGIWPHALSAFFAVQAYWFALRHLETGGKGYRDAILSGLFAGAGMLFRLDAVFAVPAIGLMMVLFAPRFIRSTFHFGAGVLPSLALASWLNYLKFGALNPFSYGKSGGNMDLATYGSFFVALCIGFGLLALFRKAGWRIDRKVAIASLVILGGALLLIPATNAWLLRLWNGFLALVVDARNIQEHRIGVEERPGHTRLFWGLGKKSLGQSMPWIGITAILLTSGVQKGDRRIFATLFIFIATMTMPFILLSWHGGTSSNMRYFLPVLPPLCILCAKLISDLWLSVSHATAFAAAGAWAATGLCLAWTLLHPSGYVGVQQILTEYVLLATALVAISAGASWRFQQIGRNLTIALFACGFIMSMTSAFVDFAVTADRRAYAHSVSQVVPDLPAKSLIIAYPEWVAVYIPGNGSILAERDPETKRIDSQLIFNALDAGYRVFIIDFDFNAARDAPPGVEPLPTSYSYPRGRFIELRRRAAPPPETNPAPRQPGPSA
jgi:hypothetical protein